MHRFAGTKALRQIAPWDASSITIDNSFDEQAIVCGGAADMANAAWQKVLDTVLLIVAKCVALHVSTSLKSTLFDSEKKRFGNPENNNI